MKNLETTRPAEVNGDTIPNDVAAETLLQIAIDLMDHGSVRISSGTYESAAILAAAKRLRGVSDLAA